MTYKCCSNCLVLLCAGAAGACAQGEVPHPFLHVHRLREPPQTLPGAQPGQAGYSRGEGGCRKCKYTSQFLRHSAQQISTIGECHLSSTSPNNPVPSFQFLHPPLHTPSSPPTLSVLISLCAWLTLSSYFLML